MSMKHNYESIFNTMDHINSHTMDGKQLKQFNKWYTKNERDIEYLYNGILDSIQRNNITLNIDNERFYDTFCIFLFNSSNITI